MIYRGNFAGYQELYNHIAMTFRVLLLVARKNKKIDMVEALKGTEYYDDQ